MDRAVLATLSLPERQLVEQTQVAALASLDEDETADLLLRVRRTRNKYTKLYRRQASAQVSSDAARGAASAKNRRTRDKAEVFEDALARVSRRLGALARQQADELRTERLQQAKSERQGRATSAPSAAATTTTGAATPHRQQRTPVRKKQVASTRATGARRQAKRDSG
jgi:hypothetical protein